MNFQIFKEFREVTLGDNIYVNCAITLQPGHWPIMWSYEIQL